MRGTIAALVSLLILSYPVWSIALRRDIDLWATDDGPAHLLRTYAIQLGFRESIAFPRWIPDLYRGYGYPVFNFYAPMTYVAGHVLTLTGLSIWNVFRLLSISAIVIGATGVYALVRVTSSRINGTCDRSPAVVAGLLYVVAPYPFITNLFIRADLPEALGLAMLPWFMLAVDQCLVTGGTEAPRTTLRGGQTSRSPVRADRRDAVHGWIMASALLGASLLLTHQLSGAMAFACAVIWTAARFATMPAATAQRGFLQLAAGGIIATGLVAFSAVPALTEGTSVQLASVQMPTGDMIEKLAVPFGTDARPLISHPSADPGEPGAVDWAWAYRYPWGVQSTFGPVKPSASHAVTAIVATLGILAVAIARLGNRPAVPRFGLLLITGAAWALNTQWTEAVWVDFTPMQFVQFPSRLYGPFSLGVAVAAGYLLDHLSAASPTLRRAGWIAGTVSAGSLAYASLAGAPLYLGTSVPHDVGPTALLRTEYNRDLWNGGAVTGNAEFTPADVDIRVSLGGRPGTPRGNQIYDREYPPGAWIASTAMAYAGTARVTELHRDGLRFDVKVVAGAPGATVALHQLRFPGWRAYLDGVETTIRVPDYDASTDSRLGFQLVDIPEGTHVVTTVFGSTTPRLVGDTITALTTVVVARNFWRRVTKVWPTESRFVDIGWVMASVAASGIACLAVGQLGTEALMSLPPRSVPAATPNLVVADLIDHAWSGRARISSPTGPNLGADKFVDIGWQLVGPLVAGRPGIVEFPHGGRMRLWLYMHPPSRVALDVTVTDRDTFFTAGMALRPEAWHTDYGDGVRFAIDIATAGSQPIEIYGQRLNPRANVDERRWVEVRLPLAA
jgi:hypothetical protein